MRRSIAVVAVLLSACGTVAAPAFAPSPTSVPTATAPAALLQAPIEACGNLKAWTPPTAAQSGTITIGSRTYSVNAGTNHGATGFVVTGATEMCVFGGLDGQTQPYHGATTIDSPFCGAVLGFTAATPTGAGSITLLHFGAVTLTSPAGTDLGTPPLGVRRCVMVRTSPGGDAVTRGLAAPTILDMENSLWCGAVKNYAVGSALVIGSRRWEIVGSAAYDTAGPKATDRTTPGKATCLTAALDDAGRITRYVTNDMPASEGGLVTSYAPPTATQPGTLVFLYKYVRSVAASASLDVELGKYACVKLALDAAGDRVVTGTMTCPTVQIG